ncbi:beta strand repeat-containing protein [Gemmata sp.]|uniref:beta strand repeat-containing protein n=1 Tax=Gemmata sp. TaxID=1914242 RepID=UPI003F718FD1
MTASPDRAARFRPHIEDLEARDLWATVTGLSPISGTSLGGTTVVISGTFTGTMLSDFAVTFEGVPATVTSFNPMGTSVTVTSPVGAANSVADVIVTDSGGASADTAADDYTYITTPTVTALSPIGGLPAGGTSVTITGTGFAGLAGTAAVKFGAVNAASYVVNSNTSITAVAPAGAAGTVDVTVTNVVGTSANTAADDYTYLAIPTITALSPGGGPIAGGNSVVITGTGFAALTGAASVMFGAVNAASYVVNSNTQITAVAPAGAAGSVNVSVTNAIGMSANTAADNYLYAAAPTVTGVSPNTGATFGGTTITITGTNFYNGATVTVGGTPATGVTVVDATTITATTPSGGAGGVDVIVTTPSGVSANTAADNYTYVLVAPPTVTAVSPTAGPVAGGTVLTITGTNFTGATGVTVGGVAATAVTVVNATTITATTPAGTAGIANVVVSNPGGPSANTAADDFTYVAAPTVTAVSPATGPAAGGTTITITGTNFTGATGVTVGGVAATAVTVVNATTITATTPAGTAGIVDVIVTTPGGPSATSAASKFTYVAAPTVTSVTPPGGPVTGGTAITITGTGFTGATAVTIGGTAATNVVVVNATTITATTPAHVAAVSPVIVTTPGGNSAPAVGATFAFDSTAPTVVISAPSAPFTVGAPVTFTITYTDANFTASSLTAANVTLNKTGTANGTVSVSAGTGPVRTVTISNITGDGTLGISIAAGTAVDVAGNLAPAAGPSTTFVAAGSKLASFAVGGANGAVRLLDDSGVLVNSFQPIAGYTGLVSVALADFDGDGTADLAVAAALPAGVAGLSTSAAGKVFVYDGLELANGKLTLDHTFTPFLNSNGPGLATGAYINGLNIAAGDVNGDGKVDLIAGSRGGTTTSGRAEYGRLIVVAQGAAANGSQDTFIGSGSQGIFPFGTTYQKGVVAAAGDLDGAVNGAGFTTAEIGVTRGGPVNSSNPAVQSMKLKVVRLSGATLQEIDLTGGGLNANGTTKVPLAPYAGLAAGTIRRDARVAFVDQDGDGKDSLVFSAIDPFTIPGGGNTVRISAFNVPGNGPASVVSTGTGPSGSYTVGAGVSVSFDTSDVVATAPAENLALLSAVGANGTVQFLNALTGAVQTGGFSLAVPIGGVSLGGL